ncbi:MAG: hypothetical protein A2622_09675 [Bdellovibrionales bacterium RIFCSPHIGHO2_01_FULL_40_29]|nr:MAG: hypothetical protein A2622_09675 [Bdellovibrionales bacterium RIFCSPHIGHO2_01_FULL_40_29]OFZ32480.1 MAG: hypothetical protein A3D17_12990 [Bdellovibrionales bacterium RIFCSPHIGHO2_02_FULL_40_15]
MDLLEKVKAARAEGSFEKTMAILNEEVAKNPENSVVHLQVAWTHDALGKEHDAIPAYEKAISMGLQGQDLSDAYLGLGSTYRTIGEYTKSKDVFDKAATTSDTSIKDYNGALLFYSDKLDQKFN